MLKFDPLPAKNRGLLWGGVVLGAGVLIALGWYTVHRPFSFTAYLLGLGWFLLAVLWVVYTYRVWALERLRYEVDRNGLYVRWGWATFTLPMPMMEEVHPPGLSLSLPQRWWQWPASYVGRWDVGEKKLFLFSSRPVEEMWFFCGPQVCVGVSPQDGQGLVKALNDRRRLGLTREHTLGWRYPSLLQHAFWQDTVALIALASGLLLLIALWGEVASRSMYPILRRTATVATLLLLGDWLLGWSLYRRERVLALTLWWTGSALLLVFLIHLWTGP